MRALRRGAFAREFNVPGGDLKDALNIYANQARVALIVSGDVIRGARTKGGKGDFTAEAALARILDGTGFTARHESGAVGIVRDAPPRTAQRGGYGRAHAHGGGRRAASVETVVVTSSKIKGDIQTVPIAITALSQEQLTSRQIAGGPDLVKEVPNLTFSKTNFTGYNIQIRGIGTQAISVTTDPAVAVAFNDMPFIRNHFFEQEFYDVSQVEVLRGPQGTLYGRNATAGVVNVISAKPTDQFEAMVSADWGNYSNRRYEGMVNIPIVDDRLDLRVAGEWTKRDGYSYQRYDRQAHRRPRSVVEPRHAQPGTDSSSTGLCRLGAFPGKRRPRPFGQTALQEGFGAQRRRRPRSEHHGRCQLLRFLAQPGLSAHIVLFEGRVRNAQRPVHSFRGGRRIYL